MLSTTSGAAGVGVARVTGAGVGGVVLYAGVGEIGGVDSVLATSRSVAVAEASGAGVVLATLGGGDGVAAAAPVCSRRPCTIVPEAVLTGT